MANSTVCQSKWKSIVEPRRAKPRTYRQAPSHWLTFYEVLIIMKILKKEHGYGAQYFQDKDEGLWHIMTTQNISFSKTKP